MPTPAPASRVPPRVPQPWPIRLTHWLTVPALVVMAASGLQILIAYPSFGARGATYGFYPLAGDPPPRWLTLGGWLAGGRALHFALAWLLVGTGIAYVVYLAASGEWRRRLFRPLTDARGAIHMALYYLRLRKQPPEQGLYNPLQRLAYTTATGLGVLQVLSGLALYKPVQLPWLVAAFGGYDAARLVHFAGLLLLAGFIVTHLVMVALHPRSLVEMIGGGAPR